jgi:hypothetical protein
LIPSFITWLHSDSPDHPNNLKFSQPRRTNRKTKGTRATISGCWIWIEFSIPFPIHNFSTRLDRGINFTTITNWASIVDGFDSTFNQTNKSLILLQMLKDWLAHLANSERQNQSSKYLQIRRKARSFHLAAIDNVYDKNCNHYQRTEKLNWMIPLGIWPVVWWSPSGRELSRRSHGHSKSLTSLQRKIWFECQFENWFIDSSNFPHSQNLNRKWSVVRQFFFQVNHEYPLSGIADRVVSSPPQVNSGKNVSEMGFGLLSEWSEEGEDLDEVKKWKAFLAFIWSCKSGRTI